MKWSKGWALILAAALLFPIRGGAELPGGLAVIAEEAFLNDSSLQSLRVPDGTVEIGARAFYGCAGLSRIVIPSTVEIMGEHCLTGCAGDLLIVTRKGAPAMTWAQEHDVDFQAGTRYRALLMAQSYRSTTAYPTLYGPANDVEQMAQCLSRIEGTAYETFIETELNADGILSAVRERFSGAEEQDVSLFYYSGHGCYSANAASRGALVGADGKGVVTAAQLRQALDAIPGRKIVIIDACYSGSFISGGEYARRARDAEESPETGAEDFLNAFTEAFSRQSRSGGYSRYFLLTGAAEYEKTFEDNVGGKIMGLFTSAFITGMGWDCRLSAPGAFLADSDQNGTVTLWEAYAYTWRLMAREGQHVQVYPSSCSWLALARQTYWDGEP